MSDDRVVKIAIIGDCGVGKTTLATYLLADKDGWMTSREKMDKYQPYVPTVGCTIHVMSLPCPTEPGEELFVELWDVGGNPRFAASRNIFYSGCDGFMFVWDASSEATYHALDQWLTEVIQSKRQQAAASSMVRGGIGRGGRSPFDNHPAVGPYNRRSSASMMSSAFAGGIMSDLDPQDGQSGDHLRRFHFSPLRARTSSASSSFAFSTFLHPPPAPSFIDHDPEPQSSSIFSGFYPDFLPSERAATQPYSHNRNVNDDIEGGTGKNNGQGSLDTPLVIIGSKADKLSSSELQELLEACAGHVFVSSRSSDARIASTRSLREFFAQCWCRKMQALEGGGSIISSNSNNNKNKNSGSFNNSSSSSASGSKLVIDRDNEGRVGEMRPFPIDVNFGGGSAGGNAISGSISSGTRINTNATLGTARTRTYLTRTNSGSISSSSASFQV